MNFSSDGESNPKTSQDGDDQVEFPLMEKEDPQLLHNVDSTVSQPDTPEQKREKMIMFVALLVCTFACMCLYMNVSSLLPAYVEIHYEKLNSFYVGCLMAIFPVGFLITAPFIGVYMESIGRKNIILVGVILITLATLAFGLASYFTNDWAFYSASFIARLLQGIAQALINITVPSIVALEFPNNQEQYLGYCNMALGLGLAVGPVLGSFAYSFLSYVNTFYFFTGYIAIIGTTCLFFIPSRINNKTSAGSDDPVKEAQIAQYKKEISYFFILKNRRSLSAFAICTFSMISSLFIDPILSLRLIDMGMNEDTTGFAFGVLGFSQTLGAPITGWLGSKTQIRIVQQTGICLETIALFMLGPSLMFGGFMPQKVWVIFVGLFFLGFTVAMMYVLVTPEIIDASGGDMKQKWVKELREQNQSEKQIQREVKKRWKLAKGVMTDKASALANMAFALGSMFGPIIGGKLSDKRGYPSTCDIICVAAFTAAIINFLFVFVPDFCKKKSEGEMVTNEEEDDEVTPITCD